MEDIPDIQMQGMQWKWKLLARAYQFLKNTTLYNISNDRKCQEKLWIRIRFFEEKKKKKQIKIYFTSIYLFLKDWIVTLFPVILQFYHCNRLATVYISSKFSKHILLFRLYNFQNSYFDSCWTQNEQLFICIMTRVSSLKQLTVHG